MENWDLIQQFWQISILIRELYSIYYGTTAEPNDWSKPISIGRPNEVMVILTKRVAIKE